MSRQLSAVSKHGTPCPSDEGAQPEQRRYRLRYRHNDVPVGEYSDFFVVTAGA
ncbi:MAG: hypothetical protein IH986_15275 [Planctomycetes bacterium]|nr:hypothetical protein [Planctomycetota bacterium]